MKLIKLFFGILFILLTVNIGITQTLSPQTTYPTSSESEETLSINDLSDGKADPIGYSVFLGKSAGFSNYGSSYFNVGIGYLAMRNNTVGMHNTAVGHRSLYSNFIGVENVAIGSNALYGPAGSKNTAGGFNTLYLNRGSQNTAFGHHALEKNTYGNFNTAIGFNSLTKNTTGNNNTALGSGAQVPNGTRNNQVRIGNIYVNYAGVQVAWDVTSDKRWKEQIRELPFGLEMIQQLRPVDYIRKNNENDTREIGFVGQEVEVLLAELGYLDQGLLHKDDKGYISLRYNDFIAILTKAIQEQQEIIEQQKTEIKTMSSRIEKIEEIIGVH